MWKDPIVEEVHRTREEQAAKHGYDLRSIVRDAHEREQKGGRKIIRAPAKINKT